MKSENIINVSLHGIALGTFIGFFIKGLYNSYYTENNKRKKKKTSFLTPPHSKSDSGMKMRAISNTEIAQLVHDLSPSIKDNLNKNDTNDENIGYNNDDDDYITKKPKKSSLRRRISLRERRNRIVVTGHDNNNKAIIKYDGLAQNYYEPPGRKGVLVQNIFHTFGSSPINIERHMDPIGSGVEVPLVPESGGTLFRIVEFSPEKDWIDNYERKENDWLPLSNLNDKKKPPHPLMHKTETIDYGIIMKGEIVLILDDREVHLKQGDVVVQVGTNHAWSNRSNSSCYIAFILMDGQYDF